MVDMAYGKTGLQIELPDNRTTVIEPTYIPTLPDERGALINAMRNPIGRPPLRRMIRPGQTVAISVCDITRPMPSATVLPVLLDELAHVPKEQITILVATGTHRANTHEELDGMFGSNIVHDYRIVNHDAFNEKSFTYAGDTSEGIPIWLNRHWLKSDVRITTGFVEPHFFAGFSGGPKMVAPGLAAFETIMRLHSAKFISNPSSTWGITDGNPIHNAIREIARQTEVHFSIDVTINRDHGITSVYAGELFTTHRAACHVARHTAMHPVCKTFDLVITSNSGYPLDLNLYQSIKGISAAAQIVRDGGTIICTAECIDGLPEHGDYKRILAERNNLKDLLEMIKTPGHNRHDQWQVQIQAEIQQRARVFLKSTYLDPDQVRAAHLEPVSDLQTLIWETIERHGRDAKVCALPQGPQTIPYVK